MPSARGAQAINVSHDVAHNVLALLSVGTPAGHVFLLNERGVTFKAAHWS